MAAKRAKTAKNKTQLSPRLVLIGVISATLATFSLMCIPCIMAAYPSIGLFFAFLGVLAMLLARYNWIFLVLGAILLALGVLLSLSKSGQKCG